MELFEKYINGFEILKQLFKDRDFDDNLLQKLDKIFATTESCWRDNLLRFNNTKVSYLLIAEAPPFPSCEEGIKYFYNSFDNKWNKQVWKAFFGQDEIPPDDQPFKRLAEKGFLLIDSIPFSMNYSYKCRRKQRLYKDLIESTSSFISDKINTPEINWADNVKYAFALKSNGRSLPAGINLPNNQEILFSDDIWVGNTFGSLESKKLESVYFYS